MSQASAVIHDLMKTLNARLAPTSAAAYERAEKFAAEAHGEYLVSKWGYDQTNINYFAVVKRTAKSVRLVEITSEQFPIDPTDSQRGGFAVPVEFQIGKPFTRRVGSDGYVRITDYQHAKPWDRTPQAYTCGG